MKINYNFVKPINLSAQIMEKKIAVLFGREGGNTERVANLIADSIGKEKCVLLHK